MAKVVSTAYVDDLDGSQASGSVYFKLDGKSYEIDLSDANAARLRDALAPFVAAARRAGGRQPAATAQRSSSGRPREETQEIREWLRSNGYPVRDRGRVPAGWIDDWTNKSPNPPTDAQQASVSEESAPDGKVVEFRSA